LGAKKIKIPKKSTDKMEEVSGLFEQAQRWAQANLRFLTGGLVGVLVISALYLGYHTYQESKEKKAQEAYFQILKQWPAEESPDAAKYEELIPKLEGLIKTHEGTKTVLNAQLDLVRAYLQVERYEDALDWGKRTLEAISPGHELQMLFRHHLALTYQKLGKIDDALILWKELTKSETSGFQREIHWHLAQIYSKKEQYAEAVEQYEKALEVPSSYPSETLIEEALALARSKIDSPSQASKENSEDSKS
jgi:tetratricopeptide (TPR) repeat protein